MSKPVFMSPEHVAQMNDLLDASDSVRGAVAQLERRYVMAYRLSDGPDGGDVHWQMIFDPAEGVSFSLEPPADGADMTLLADWAAMVRGSRDNREGKAAEMETSHEGDPGVLEIVGPVFAAAQHVATVPVEFPDVGP